MSLIGISRLSAFFALMLLRHRVIQMIQVYNPRRLARLSNTFPFTIPYPDSGCLQSTGLHSMECTAPSRLSSMTRRGK